MATKLAGRFFVRVVALAAVCCVLTACPRRPVKQESAKVVVAATQAKPPAQSRQMIQAVSEPLKPEPPFRVALEWLAGPRDLPAVLYVRILPAPRHRLSPPVTNPPPLHLSVPADWAAALELRRQDAPATTAQPWTSGWKIITASKATQLQIQSGSFYQLSCVVEAAAAPPPGALVTATLKLGNLTVQSSPLTVPPPPIDEREAKLTGVTAALAAGDTASALAVADRWIAAEPARHEGYWCRGLTLEAKSDVVGALAAYRAALERYPKPADIGSGWEPPGRLWQKVEALERR